MLIFKLNLIFNLSISIKQHTKADHPYAQNYLEI